MKQIKYVKLYVLSDINSGEEVKESTIYNADDCTDDHQLSLYKTVLQQRETIQMGNTCGVPFFEKVS